MTQFRCRTCAKFSARRIPPAECPRKDECDFELVDATDVAAAVLAPPVVPVPSVMPDPSIAMPAPSQPVAPPAHVRLAIAGRSWTIRGHTVLGRNGDVASDAFREDTSISRRHCEIEPGGPDGWILRALSATSPTVLNGGPVPPGPAVALPPGQNRLVLGGRLTVELSVPGEVAPASVEAFLGALEETIRGEWKQ